MRISDIKLLYKILGCFAALTLAIGGAVWFSSARLASVDSKNSALISNDTVTVAASLRAAESAYNFARLNWRLMALTDPAPMKQTIAEIGKNQKEFLDFMATARTATPELASRIDKLNQTFEALTAEDVPLQKANLDKNKDEAWRLLKPLAPKIAKLRADIDAMSTEVQQDMTAKSKAASKESASTILMMAATIGGTLVLVIVFSACLVKFTIVNPIGSLVEAMRELASGNFSVTLTNAGRKDEVGQIATAMERVVESVGSMIGNIKKAASEVTNASAEISTSTTDLSQRTEEQAASLEETSASMEQISATVKKNAENAQQANKFATETNTIAERGGAVVSEAVTAMARIEESSRKISDIISVIDEIARQTNLLALNAAVEAARAGEAGRGFAVVASEVRSLAQRSSQAAKDIKDLITNSNSEVKDGVDLVNKAGASLDEIVTSIKKVTTIVGDIATASLEQASGIEQVNKALTQMDEATQQNSALVEENAATAKTLEHQAVSMDQRVAAFRLRDGAGRDDDTETAPQTNGGERTGFMSKGAATPKQKPPAEPKKFAAGHHGGPVARMHEELAMAVNE